MPSINAFDTNNIARFRLSAAIIFDKRQEINETENAIDVDFLPSHQLP